MLLKSLKTVITAMALVVILAICGTLIPNPVWSSATPRDAAVVPSDMKRILVLSNPIHTDIAIPVDDALRARFGFLAGAGLDVQIEGIRYLVFGWGGRAFYTETPTWAELKAIPVLKSLTLDASVMHVEFAGEIRQGSPGVTAIDIDGRSAERLIDFITASFAGGPQGPVLVPGYAYGDYDAFYEANGSFNALAGCNTWTAAALRQAGVSTGWWTPLPWMLRLSLRLHNDAGILAP